MNKMIFTMIIYIFNQKFFTPDHNPAVSHKLLSNLSLKRFIDVNWDLTVFHSQQLLKHSTVQV